MKKKISARGAAMVWVLCVLALICILVTGVLYLSTAYFNRSLNYGRKQQAYLTSKSAVDIVIEKLKGQKHYQYSDYSLDTPFPVSFGDDEQSGACTALIKREGNELVVSATTEFQGQDSTVTARCALDGGVPDTPIPLDQNGYYTRDSFEEESGLNGWGGVYGANVALTSEYSYNGTYSAMVSNRNRPYHGLGLFLNSATFSPGSSFSISSMIYFPHVESYTADKPSRIKMSIAYSGDPDAGTICHELAAIYITDAEAGQWLELKRENYTLLNDPKFYNYRLYFETANSVSNGTDFLAELDFCVDEIILAPANTTIKHCPNIHHAAFEPEDGGTTPKTRDWVVRKSSDATTAVPSADQSKEGIYSMFVSGRTGTWQGIQRKFLLTSLEASKNYCVSCWIYVLPDVSSTPLDFFLSYEYRIIKDDGGTGTRWGNIVDGEVAPTPVTTGVWTKVVAYHYTFPTANASSNYGNTIFIETPLDVGSLCDFYVDEIVISEGYYPNSNTAKSFATRDTWCFDEFTPEQE